MHPVRRARAAVVDLWQPIRSRRASRRMARLAARAVRASNATRWLALVYLTVTSAGQSPVGRALAANPATPARCRRTLAGRGWDVGSAVAASPLTPAAILERLATSKFWGVQAAVAANPTTPPPVLSWLADWPFLMLRMAVAANPSTNPADIARLLRDRSAYVRCVAASHPRATPAGLAELARPMQGPAWVLRAAAANPACPAELSDEVLTWLALGGAGGTDPMFDPITCEGHPGQTQVPLHAWYSEQARAMGGHQHPLWRVRAAVTSSLQTIPGPVLMWLSTDPRPEVRRTVARFRQLTRARLRELRDDADERVAALALMAIVNKAKAGPTRRFSWQLTLIARLAFLAFVIYGGIRGATSGNFSGGPSSSGPPDAGSGVSVAAGTQTDEESLPAGGTVVAGTLPDISSDFVTVTAGAVALNMVVPGAYMTPDGSTIGTAFTVPSGTAMSVILQGGNSTIFVDATPMSAAAASTSAVPVSFDGAGQ
jgi:hypothetical protein